MSSCDIQVRDECFHPVVYGGLGYARLVEQETEWVNNWLL
jgi:hypothetical protein